MLMKIMTYLNIRLNRVAIEDKEKNILIIWKDLKAFYVTRRFIANINDVFIAIYLLHLSGFHCTAVLTVVHVITETFELMTL